MNLLFIIFTVLITFLSSPTSDSIANNSDRDQDQNIQFEDVIKNKPPAATVNSYEKIDTLFLEGFKCFKAYLKRYFYNIIPTLQEE